LAKIWQSLFEFHVGHLYLVSGLQTFPSWFLSSWTFHKHKIGSWNMLQASRWTNAKGGVAL